jgi:hypothetical protein
MFCTFEWMIAAAARQTSESFISVISLFADRHRAGRHPDHRDERDERFKVELLKASWACPAMSPSSLNWSHVRV